RAPVRFPLAVVAAAVSLVAFDASAQSSSEKKWSETVVTATRTPTLLDETLSDVTVITKEQLQAMGPGRTVVEVLQRLAGVQINSNGGRGQSQSVFIRGSESRHTLVLVDGARYGSVASGQPSFANIPIELIERIEVVKGPASSLYGSEAIGGVIQIFTKRASAAGSTLQKSASVTLGQRGHRSLDASLLGKQADFDYQLSAARVVDHGFSARRTTDALQSDDDGFSQTSFNVGVGYDINPDWRAEASLIRSTGRARFDASDRQSFMPFVDMTTSVSQLALKGALSERWTTHFRVSESMDRQVNLDGSWNSYNQSNQREWKWDQQIQTGFGTALVGVERIEQDIDSGSPVATPTSRNINAVLAGLTGAYLKHSWQLSARRDDNSQFGAATTYGVNYGYEVVDGVRFFAGNAKSMRAPTFADQFDFWGNNSPYNGNPNLTPEKSRNTEFGVQIQQGQHQAKWLRYDNRVSDLIAAGSQHKINVPGETRLRGWTAEYAFHAKSWQLTTGYDWLKARQADGQVPVARATSQLRVGLDKTIGKWKLGATALRAGARKDFSGKMLDAYATLDLSARYAVSRDMALQIKLANATDRQYAIADGYNTLGRTAYVTLQWTPQ
ncbi:MAG: TonB-dependent receptor domain-containing protein, partial [Comamonas sp.]